MTAVLKVFEAARVPLSYNYVDMGKSIYLGGHSTGMTPDARDTVERLGILFKGPMETPKGTGVFCRLIAIHSLETNSLSLLIGEPGVKSINVTARKVWNTYANKRVFRSLPGVPTVFSKAGIPVDLTLFRENIEDTYGGIEHFQTHDVAQCRRLISRPGSLQIHRMAFETALSKEARRITCVHKANIMKLTDGLFLDTFYEVAKDYPSLKADDTIVDDLAMKLTMTPDVYDVLVLPNLQGDIISDLCAGLVGGLGMAPVC
jgi:isocitrate dehydrogenase